MRGFVRSLFGQVVIALIVGILLGWQYPGVAVALKPLGDGFIKLIKMLIAPLVFGVVVHGIVGAGDLRKAGRVGLKAIIYFEVLTTIALVTGVVLAYVVRPGVGMNIDVKTLDASALSAYTSHIAQVTNEVDVLMRIIPTTVVDAFAQGDILQVLLFAILFGVGLAMLGQHGQTVTHCIEESVNVLFKVIGLIVKLAPLGVLGAVAFTVGKYGVASLEQLGMLVALYYVAAALFVLIVLGGVMWLAGFSLFKFLRYLREELLIVFGTASSDAVLPQVMRKLEAMGIKDSTVGLVIPLGYSFNLDGFSIYLSLAAVFVAQATNTHLSTGDLLMVLGAGAALLTSKGASGVPGSAIVVLAATLSAIPVIPAIGLVLVLSVDWFMGIARAVSNLIGNCVATVVIAVWEGDIDRDRAKQVLEGHVSTEELLAKTVEMDPVSEPKAAI
jgi:aerobic C4-dicarboxylate transport protein